MLCGCNTGEFKRVYNVNRWAVQERRKMIIADEILDKAYSIYEEFGPDRLIDRKERLSSELQISSKEEIDEIIKIMKEITSTVWKIAEKGGEIKLGKEEARRQITMAHPYLKGKGLDTAAFLVNYFAWHEGYDK